MSLSFQKAQKQLLLIVLLFICSGKLIFGQIPLNDDAINATTIVLDAQQSYCSVEAVLTTAAATADGIRPSGWGNRDYVNVWYKFSPAANGVANITVKNGGSYGTMGFMMLSLHRLDGTELSSVGRTTRRNNVGLVVSGLNPEDEYLINVAAQDRNNGPGTFTLCVNDQPDYDYKSAAMPLTMDVDGDYCSANEEFSTLDATPDEATPANWTQNPNQNVWFQFTPDDSGIANIKVKRGNGFGSAGFLRVALWNDNNEEVGSGEESVRYSNTGLLATGLDSDKTYYISVDALSRTTGPGTFTLCIQNELDNDFKEGAMEIVLDAQGRYVSADAEFTNAGATADGIQPVNWVQAPNQNVWFKFKPASNGMAEIQVKSDGDHGTMGYVMMAVFREDNTELASASNELRKQDMGLLLEGLDPEQFYFISVDAMAKNNGPGSFSLEINSNASFDYQEGAIELLLDGTENYCSANAEFSNTDATPDGVRATNWTEGPNKNVWFRFKPASNGRANIVLKRGGDYGTMGFAMMALYNNEGTEIASASNDIRHKNLGLLVEGLNDDLEYFISVDILNKTVAPGTFSLCIKNEVTSDYLADPVEISLDASGNYLSANEEFTTEGATGDGPTFQTWTEEPVNNVWFRIAPETDGQLDVEVMRGGNKGDGAYFRMGLIDSEGHEMGSEGSEAISPVNSMSVLDLKGGEEYFLTVDNRSQGNRSGTFTLAMSFVDANCIKSPVLYLDDTGGALLTEEDVVGANCSWPCPSGECTRTISQTQFDCENLGDNVVTVTGEDAQGNTYVEEVTVQVIDNIAPNLVVIAGGNFALGEDGTRTFDIEEIIALGPGGVSEPTPQPYPSPGNEDDAINNGSDWTLSTSDNCGITEMGFIGRNTFTCDDVGQPLIITVYVKDQSGNQTTATTEITVFARNFEVLYNAEVTLALDETGNAVLTPEMVDNGTTSDCGTNAITLSLSRTEFSCEDLGAQTVEFSAKRPRMGSQTRQVTVNVVDQMAPIVVTQDLNIAVAQGESVDLSPQDFLVLFSRDGNYTRDNCTLNPAGYWDEFDLDVSLPLTVGSVGVYNMNIEVNDRINNSPYRTTWGSATLTVTTSPYDCTNELWAIKSGDWDDPTTWSATEGGPPANYIPCAQTVVHISGHSVTFNQPGSLRMAKRIEMTGVSEDISTGLSVRGGTLNVKDEIVGSGEGLSFKVASESRLRVVKSPFVIGF